MAKIATVVRQRLFGPVPDLKPFDHLIPRDKQVAVIKEMMARLGKQKQQTIDFVVALEDFDPLAVRFQRFDSVATYSLLRRRSGEGAAELCAVGMLLSGVDAAYDAAIIKGVETMNDDIGKPLGIDADVFRQVRKDQERPMSVAYFFKEAPMRDGAMRWTVRSLAEVFFALIGVFKATP